MKEKQLCAAIFLLLVPSALADTGHALGEGSIFDNTIHIATTLTALVLFAISLVTYLRTKRPKLLIICCAFLVFAIKELLVSADVIFFQNPLLTATSHFLTFVVLLLFFWGVMK